MADIPDYLLERSRERRALLTGQDPGPASGGGGAAASPAADAAATPAVASAGAAAAAPAAAAPQIPAPQPVPAPPAPPQPPVKPWVSAARARQRIPFWVMPILLFLPIWAIIYAGTLESPTRAETGLLAEGAEVYAETAACASCHGGEGAGTSAGPALSKGEVLLTFPDDKNGLGLAQQIAWIVQGTNGTGVGRPYGSPDRGRVAGWFGEMSAFGDQITAEELLAVTLYERASHGGSEVARTIADLVEETLASGELVLPEYFTQDMSVGDILTLLQPVVTNEEFAAAHSGDHDHETDHG